MAFSQIEVLAEAIAPFLSSPCCRHSLEASLNLHQPGTHSSSHQGDFLRPHPTHLAGPPKPLQWLFYTNEKPLAHAATFPKISQRFTNNKQAASLCPTHLISGAKLGTSGSQLHFAPQPLPGTSKPSTSSNHLKITLHIPGGPKQDTQSR